MEGNGDAERDRPVVDNSAVEGDGDRGRYSVMRCASQSSLDESSQRPGPAGGECGAAHAHSAALLSALGELRAARLLCDVVLRALPEHAAPEHAAPEHAAPEHAEHEHAEHEHAGAPAHRAVLAACSPYFRAMFTQFDERTMHTVTIQNIEPYALEAIIDYIYDPDSLVITEDNVQALLSGSSLVQVCGVRALCCAFLTGALSADNALGIRAFAELHACAELAAAAARYVQAHAAQVLCTDEFLALPAPQLAALLDCDRLTVPGEDAVLAAVERWAGADPARAAELGAVLEHVRLPLVPHEVLVARAGAEPLASAGLRVKDLVIEALSYHLLAPGARLAAAARCARARPRRPPRAPRLLLVVGGQAPKAIREVEALPLGREDARWRCAAELPARRCRAGLAVLGDKVYAIGGFNGTLRVRSVDVYCSATDSWSAGPALGARRSTLGVAVLDDRIYAVGGFDGAQGLSSAEVLEGGAWRPIAHMATRRSSVGVCALAGCVYAVGGYDGLARACLSSVERYEPAADRWQPVADMAARRSGAAVAVLADTLYALGGHDGPAVRRSVEKYAVGGSWSAAGGMCCARRNAGAAAHGGRVYVVGGDDGAHNLPSAEAYDPAADCWTALAPAMQVPRSYAGVAVVDLPARPDAADAHAPRA